MATLWQHHGDTIQTLFPAPWKYVNNQLLHTEKTVVVHVVHTTPSCATSVESGLQVLSVLACATSPYRDSKLEWQLCKVLGKVPYFL